MTVGCYTEYPQKGVARVTWPDLDAGESGQAAGVTRWQEKTIQITGSLGTTTITIQGSNDGTNWATLNSKGMDADSAIPLSGLGVGIYSILENPAFIRPVASAGDSSNIPIVLNAVAWD